MATLERRQRRWAVVMCPDLDVRPECKGPHELEAPDLVELEADLLLHVDRAVVRLVYHDLHRPVDVAHLAPYPLQLYRRLLSPPFVLDPRVLEFLLTCCAASAFFATRACSTKVASTLRLGPSD